MSFYASQSLRRGSSEMLPHRKWPGNILPFFPLIKLQQSLITIRYESDEIQCDTFKVIFESREHHLSTFSCLDEPAWGSLGLFYTISMGSRRWQYYRGMAASYSENLLYTATFRQSHGGLMVHLRDSAKVLFESRLITKCPVLHCKFNQQLFNFTNLRASIVLSPFGKCSSRAKTTQFAMIVNKTAYSKGGHSIINFV